MCVCPCPYLKEEDYEWGSRSILDALPFINSQQKRLAQAALRWRKALQGCTDQEVYTSISSSPSHAHLKTFFFLMLM